MESLWGQEKESFRGQGRHIGVASDEAVFLAGGDEDVGGWWSSTVVCMFTVPRLDMKWVC